jgi:hypothetical protein
MADNPFLGGGLRPDQQKWASTGMGAMSPMWLPFIAAASAGAAWWAMTHWARVMGAGYPGVAARGSGSDGARPSAGQSAGQSNSPSNGAERSAHPSAQPLDAVSARSTEVAAPQDAPVPGRDNSVGSQAEALAAGLSDSSAAREALSESLAVQGEDASADAVMPEAPPEAAVTARAAAPAAEPAPKPATVSSASADAPASVTDNDDHPAPTLPPHEGLPARKKGGAKKKA